MCYSCTISYYLEMRSEDRILACVGHKCGFRFLSRFLYWARHLTPVKGCVPAAPASDLLGRDRIDSNRLFNQTVEQLAAEPRFGG